MVSWGDFAVGLASGLILIVAGAFFSSLWKKSPMETDYATLEHCKKCREECRIQRNEERADIREALRQLGNSIDSLRQTVIDMLKPGGK